MAALKFGGRPPKITKFEGFWPILVVKKVVRRLMLCYSSSVYGDTTVEPHLRSIFVSLADLGGKVTRAWDTDFSEISQKGLGLGTKTPGGPNRVPWALTTEHKLAQLVSWPNWSLVSSGLSRARRTTVFEAQLRNFLGKF